MDKQIGTLYLLECMKSFKGLKSTCEKAISQLDNAQMHQISEADSNSVVIIMKHMAGSMLSRWTDFLTTDGEKSDRNRDGEFEDDFTSRDQLMQFWERGWVCLFQALAQLQAHHLTQNITIRGEDHTVLRAINRQLAHYSYHTGQIVFVSKMLLGTKWRTLSIPKKEA